MQLLLNMFSTLMSLEDRLRLKLKVLCMAIMLATHGNPYIQSTTILSSVAH